MSTKANPQLWWLLRNSNQNQGGHGQGHAHESSGHSSAYSSSTVLAALSARIRRGAGYPEQQPQIPGSVLPQSCQH